MYSLVAVHAITVQLWRYSTCQHYLQEPEVHPKTAVTYDNIKAQHSDSRFSVALS